MDKVNQFITCCLLLGAGLFADVKSDNGTIRFDYDSDQASDAVLNSTGFGIGVNPSANLHVQGNAVVSEQLFIGGDTGSSNLDINGTIGFGTMTLTSNTTLSNHAYYFVDTSSTNITLTLPDASTVTGRQYCIKRVTDDDQQLRLTSSSNIDDESLPYDLAQLSAIKLMSDGTQWLVVNIYDNATQLFASDNLVGWWKFDETSGTTVLDSSDNSSIGTFQGGASFDNDSVAGAVGRAIDLDGTDDDIYFNSPDFSDLMQMTICAWIYPRSGGQNNLGRIFHKRNNNTGRPSFLMDDGFAGDNSLRFEVGFSGSSGFWNSDDFVIMMSAWNFVAVTYDGSSDANDPTFYVNGTATGNTNSNPSGTIVADDSNLWIGNRSDMAREFDGYIDDVRVYNKVLSADEIQSIYQQVNLD